MRWFAFALLAGVSMAPADLDVRVPPGTPLDWNRELSRPVPSGHRGGRPSVATESAARPSGGRSTEVMPKGPVQTPWRPTLEYTVVSHYEIFLGTSADCPSHLKWGTPPKSKPQVTQDDVASEGGYVIQWNYPPTFPAELVWVGLLASLRERIHPRAISWAEAAAHCVEVGEPAFLGASMGEGRVAAYMAGMETKLPLKLPEIPRHDDPLTAGLYHLAAVELSGGFPQALDPAFARRTLALGEEMYDAVLECSRSANLHLARNAVLILHGFPKATPDLIKLWKESSDRTFRLRALRALAERREASIVPDLAGSLLLSDLPMTSAAIYALGQIGDPAGGDAVARLLLKDRKGPVAAENVDWSQTEVLWSAIPALGRMKAAKDLLMGMEIHLRRKMGVRDETPREDPHHDRLFRQMCLIALAQHEVKAALDEAVARVKAKGFESFHQATHYQLIDVLASTPEGAAAMKAKSPVEGHVRLAMIQALSRNQRITSGELEQIALKEAEGPAVRVKALQLLLDHDGPTARTVCRKIVADFAKLSGPIEAGTGMVVSAAAQVGGMVEAFDAAALVPATKRAFEQGCFARREGNNETNLAETKIFMFPALLETLAIELGRTREAAALPVLKRVFQHKAYAQGRAEAIVAIGALPGKEADGLLVDGLSDKDGWVRFCAYRALARRSGEDHFASWVWMDNAPAAKKAVAAYKEWYKKKYAN